ncbi:MAG: isochorismatase family protein [Spirochaetaceae bacterium]|nr:isochorismatase family protein [Spirochaetaceae bacterium]
MILLVVDTQKGCFDERLYSFETVRKNIKQLITTARENNVEVVYVQHDDGPGKDLDKATEEVAKARNGDWHIILTPEKPVPRDWFPSDMKGSKKSVCIRTAI